MNFVFAIFFGAGVAAFAYTKLGRRAGYGNTKDIVTITAVSFIIAVIFFYTILAFVIGSK